MITKEVSVVLGSYNRVSFLKLTIDSLRREFKILNKPAEIIVVDGGSTDGTIKWLTKQKDIISIIQYNRGKWKGKPIERRSWGYFMNLGFKSAQGKYVLMISDDCILVPNSISNAYELFEEKIINNDKLGALAFYYRNIPIEKKYNLAFYSGKKLILFFGMFRKDVLEKVNYVDENYYFYFGDTDLTLKIWNYGYEIEESPDSYIEHYYHTNPFIRSSNMELYKIDEDRFYNKWEKIFSLEEIKNVTFKHKNYSDIYNEWKKFLKFEIFNFNFFILKVKNKLKKINNLSKKILKNILRKFL